MGLKAIERKRYSNKEKVPLKHSETSLMTRQSLEAGTFAIKNSEQARTMYGLCNVQHNRTLRY